MDTDAPLRAIGFEHHGPRHSLVHFPPGVVVARLARHLAERAGRSGEALELIEIAGLLHDLGKLRVPDELLEKPGPLDDAERAMMSGHSYDIFQALAQERPYRSSLAAEEALEMLKRAVEEGKLDGEVVGMVEEDLESCYRIALGGNDSAE